MFNLFLYRKGLILAGYLLSVTFLAVSGAFAYSSITTPVSVPPMPVPAATVNITPIVGFSYPALPQGTPEEIRNPFAKGLPPPAVKAQVEPAPSGPIKLKAVIISLKNGIVIEEQGRGVYFLSEGESVNGYLVKKITSSDAVLEKDGQEITITLEGKRP